MLAERGNNRKGPNLTTAKERVILYSIYHILVTYQSWNVLLLFGGPSRFFLITVVHTKIPLTAVNEIRILDHYLWHPGSLAIMTTYSYTTILLSSNTVQVHLHKWTHSDIPSKIYYRRSISEFTIFLKQQKMIFQLHLSLNLYSLGRKRQNTFHALLTNGNALSTINKTIL